MTSEVMLYRFSWSHSFVLFVAREGVLLLDSLLMFKGKHHSEVRGKISLPL